MAEQTAVEWLDRWFRDNPESTHEEGNKALEQAKQMEKKQMEISDEEITDMIELKMSEDFTDSDEMKSNMFYRLIKESNIEGAKWYREQLKHRQ